MAAQDERRRVPRRRTKMTVAAAWDEPPQVVRGVMKDFSELGARILLDDGSQDPPDQFDLIQISAGILYESRVVWRADQFIGVAFERTIQLKGVREPRLMKRAQLWIRLLGR
jgi:hypothetical protein